jgi:crotonobetainyl-CoA:carnitine CoA-transferase CaiB-like acyl-CoA transferase
LGEGPAEYTETVRFPGATAPNKGGQTTPFYPTFNAPMATVNPVGRGRKKRFKGTTWLWIALVIVFGMGGLMSVTGYPDDEGGAPVKTGPSIADFIGGQFAVIGVIAALYERDANGSDKGQQVDIALLDSVIASLSHYTAQYLATGEVPVRRGTQGNGGLPSQMFPCADGAVMVVCGNDEQYRRFCSAINHPELADDSRFISNPDRVRNRKPLAQTFDAITIQWKQQDMLDAMEKAGVPAGPIYNLEQVFADPQVQHRGMAMEVPHPLAGTVKIYTNPIKLSDTPITRYTAPPTLGQHTEEVLKGLLGLSEERIAALAKAKII